MVARAPRTPSAQVGPDVLDAAVTILDLEGPDGFTVRALAERAGVAPMAIYNHFDGMNGLLEALWVKGFTQLRSALSVTTDDPLADVVAVGHHYRTFALENRGLYTVMFMHRFRGFVPTIPAAQLAAQTFQTVVTLVERCQRVGGFVDVRAHDAAQVIWSATHGYVALELLGINFTNDRDATFTRMLHALRDGYASRSVDR